MSLTDAGRFAIGVGERVHTHELQLKELGRKVERFGGSVLDEMALDRRLRKIEDGLSSNAE